MSFIQLDIELPGLGTLTLRSSGGDEQRALAP